MTALFRQCVFLCACAHVTVHACMRVCVCVSCVRVGVSVRKGSGWVGVRLILSCISTGAGLGHINILINTRESITEEARA